MMDGIFRGQGGSDTLVSLKEEGGPYLASLVIGLDRAGSPPAVEPELALRGRASRRLADCFAGRGTAFSAASPMERAA